MEEKLRAYIQKLRQRRANMISRSHVLNEQGASLARDYISIQIEDLALFIAELEGLFEEYPAVEYNDNAR